MKNFLKTIPADIKGFMSVVGLFLLVWPYIEAPVDLTLKIAGGAAGGSYVTVLAGIALILAGIQRDAAPLEQVGTDLAGLADHTATLKQLGVDLQTAIEGLPASVATATAASTVGAFNQVLSAFQPAVNAPAAAPAGTTTVTASVTTPVTPAVAAPATAPVAASVATPPAQIGLVGSVIGDVEAVAAPITNLVGDIGGLFAKKPS